MIYCKNVSFSEFGIIQRDRWIHGYVARNLSSEHLRSYLRRHHVPEVFHYQEEQETEEELKSEEANQLESRYRRKEEILKKWWRVWNRVPGLVNSEEVDRDLEESTSSLQPFISWKSGADIMCLPLTSKPIYSFVFLIFLEKNIVATIFIFFLNTYFFLFEYSGEREKFLR